MPKNSNPSKEKTTPPQMQPDLQHRDWLMRSITKMIQKIDLKIRIKQKKRGQSKLLILENVSESNLNQLNFITNTDQNNNYLYLESVKVFLNNDYEKTPIFIPGLLQIMLDAWNEADNVAFMNDQKYFYPFMNPLNGPSVPNLVTSYVSPITIPNYIDIFTSMSPYVQNTYGVVKTFTLVLNPDCSGCGDYASDGSGCCSSCCEGPDGMCAKGFCGY